MAVATYALPPGCRGAGLLQIAASNHLLLFGELHGTREVPAVVAGLLPKLVERGYRGLGLEVPRDQQAPLTAWADGLTDQPPPFFARPSRDGRGNTQVLELVKTARALGIELVCFDQAPDQVAHQWADRDDLMARNLLEAWSHLPVRKLWGFAAACTRGWCPSRGWDGCCAKRSAVVSSCGEASWRCWVRQHQPGVHVGAVEVRFAAGEYYNMGEKTIFTRPSARTEPWTQDVGAAFTVALWLPRAKGHVPRTTQLISGGHTRGSRPRRSSARRGRPARVAAVHNLEAYTCSRAGTLASGRRPSGLAVSSRGVQCAACQETAHEHASFADRGAVDDGGDRVGRVVVRDVGAARAAGAHGQQAVAAADDARPALVAGITAGSRGPRPPRLRRLRLPARAASTSHQAPELSLRPGIFD